jgi:hypothetical protein
VLHGGAGKRLLERRGEILQHDHRLGAGVLQLVLQLVRGIERVHVDGDEARPQHGRYGHRILQHVGHHERHARAALQAAALQPRRQGARQRVDLAEGQRLVEADIGLGVTVLGEALLEQRHDTGVDRRIDIRRHARRIILEPEAIHLISSKDGPS